MVYVNKRERNTEEQVCNFILNRVLNQGNLSKITGITTQIDLQEHEKERIIEQKRQKLAARAFKKKQNKVAVDVSEPK